MANAGPHGGADGNTTRAHGSLPGLSLLTSGWKHDRMFCESGGSGHGSHFSLDVRRSLCDPPTPGLLKCNGTNPEIVANVAQDPGFPDVVKEFRAKAGDCFLVYPRWLHSIVVFFRIRARFACACPGPSGLGDSALARPDQRADLLSRWHAPGSGHGLPDQKVVGEPWRKGKRQITFHIQLVKPPSI